MDMPSANLLPPDMEADSDRRDSPRLRAVCRIAKIVRVDDVGLWMVRNISDGGLMLTTSVPVTVGENITIILAEELVLNGHVLWASDGQCGVTFDDEVDGEAVLRQLAQDKTARRYRPFRIALNAAAVANVNHRMQPIALVNLSQHGAGIIHDGSVAAGMRLDLLLAGTIRREAIVRWSRDDRAGLWLTQPLERGLLESIRKLDAAPDESVVPPKPVKAKRQKS